MNINVLETKGVELLFQVITNCYERKSLIITTNLELAIFIDKKLVNSCNKIDRIIH
ncbi:MAG: ATP-binding protein [Cetobacterium sp.]|uniref:ATP-binding protein n=1 Tax=Cetobacterium sp. TaxID=2071632 RepID=UPI003F2CF4D9